MKIIFLDFNGILDTYENMDEINPDNLKRLKQIIESTNAKVVISSSLKNSYYYLGSYSKHLKEIIETLENYGIEVIGITPLRATREEEIKNYLLDHPEVENYCILDDDYEMEDLKTNLVKLPLQNFIGQTGLEDSHMEKAIKILNRTLK